MPLAPSGVALESLFLKWVQSTDDGGSVFTFLADRPEVSLDEQVAVLLVDQARSWRGGDGRSIEEYFAQLPALRDRPDLAVQLIAEEFGYRQERGERVAADEYLLRFPDCADQLQSFVKSAAPSAQLSDTPPPAGDSTAEVLQASQLTATYVPGTAPASGSVTANHQIGDYEILGEIARGGMGVVYRARHVRLGNLAAVKLIRAGEFAGPNEIRRFYDEARAAAKLSHPGIVSVHQVGEHAGQHFLAMAYIEGQSLWQRVKESPLEPKFAARLMQQVAEAVHYAHGQQIIHRDLKPQNILLTADDQPKVTDFGLAKNQANDSSLTDTGDVLGTPSYMPPEQAAGKADQAGPPADVYSLGATLYCLLTGRPPFQAASKLETLLQVVEQEPVSLRQMNAAIPRDLETICLKSLQKEPAKRYPSAAALADDLQRFQRGEPILARPIGRLERGWRWCRRNPVVAGLSTTAVLLMTCMIVVSLAGWHITQTQAETLRDQLYAAQMQSAHRAWSEAALGRCEELLRPWKPNSRQPDRRDWEWHYLNTLRLKASKDPFEGHTGPVDALAVSPDGTKLASAGGEDGIRVWELGTRREIRHIPFDKGAGAICVAWSADGKRIVTGENRNGRIAIWDVATGEQTFTVKAHLSTVFGVAWSRDQRWIASSGGDGFIKVWDANSGECVATTRCGDPIPNAPEIAVWSVQFHPERAEFAAADDLGRIAVFGDADWKKLRSTQIGQTWSLSWSPDGARIAAAVQPGVVAILDAETLKVERRFETHRSIMRSARWAPDSRRIATGSRDRTIKVWNVPDQKLLAELRGSTDEVMGLTWMSDGKTILAGGRDRLIRVFSADGVAESSVLLEHPSPATSMAWSPSARKLAVGCHEGEVAVLDADSGRELWQTTTQPGPVVGIVWSPSGDQVLTSGQRVRIWDAQEGKLVKEYDPMQIPADVVWSHDGSTIYSAGALFLVWKPPADGHEIIRSPNGGTLELSAVRGKPEMMAATPHGFVEFWNTTNSKMTRSYRLTEERQSLFSISPDGKWLASVPKDRHVIHVWDATSGRRVSTLVGHTDVVSDCAWHPSGNRLATSSWDGLIKIWDPRSGHELLSLAGHKSHIYKVSWSADGRSLASGGFTTTHLWDCDLELIDK